MIHFTLFGIILPAIKLKVHTFGGLKNSATKSTSLELWLSNKTDSLPGLPSSEDDPKP